MKLLVTGGAGFIGSAVVRLAVARGHQVVNLDALTYAACLDNLASVAASPLYAFERADIRDRAARLRAAGDARLSLHLAGQAGQTHSVLMESPRLGRTEQFAEVVVESDQPEGRIILADITGTTGQQLAGRVRPA